VTSRVLLVFILPLAAVVATACGDDTTTSSVDLSDKTFTNLTSSAEVEVQARDNVFAPAYIEVSRGTTITFANDGRNPHNVLPVDDRAFPPIEAEDLQPEDTGTVTFDQPGDYPYYCSLHGTTTRGMVGAVRVVE
jgi:plastocyanin